MNAQEVAMAQKINDMSKVLATLSGQNSAHFLVTALSPSQAPQAITRNCKLMLPAWFVQQHQDKLKLQDFVVLRSATSTIPCTVRLGATKTSALKSSKTYLGKGWKAFARNNELAIGDSLIFHLRGTSDFHVHIFRGTRAIPASHAPTKRSSDSELSPKNAQYDSSAGCSAHQQGSDHGSQPGEDHLCEAVAKKRKAVGSEDAGAACTPTGSPSLIKLHPSELENVQVSSLQMRQGQEPQKQKTTPCGAQNCRRSVHVKEELQPPGESMPSFIQRLVKLNVQDSAGNTSGARFDVPFSFLKKHNVQLQQHVKLQGTREESPFRVVTCTCNMLQDSAERSGGPPLSLGWGDFVRDNALHEGQQLVFTLVSESVFVIKEVSEIVIYTK